MSGSRNHASFFQSPEFGNVIKASLLFSFVRATLAQLNQTQAASIKFHDTGSPNWPHVAVGVFAIGTCVLVCCAAFCCNKQRQQQPFSRSLDIQEEEAQLLRSSNRYAS